MNARRGVVLLSVCAAVAGCGVLSIREASGDEVSLAENGAQPFPRTSSSAQDTTPPPGWGDDGTVIDVLVVYTARAEADFAASGRSIEESINLAAAQADSAFRNSGIDLHVNIVHHQRVGFKEKTGLFGRGDLDRLFSPAGEEIRALRRRYRADEVTLIRGKGGKNVALNLTSIATTSSNIARRYSEAYSVVNSSCVDQSYRCFVHELGHVLGAGHNVEEGAHGLYEDSYGYHFPERITKQTPCVFGTMQDYECADDLRILHFSNPVVSFQGHPTGVAGRANNARAINAAKHFVANYEQSSLRGTTP